MVKYNPLWLGSSLLATAAGLWLVFWSPDSIVPALRYGLGSLMLGLGASQTAIQFAVRRQTTFEQNTSAAEVKAWLSLFFIAAITAYLLAGTPVLATGPAMDDAARIGVKLMAILVFWIVIAAVLRGRRGDVVLEDERDRAIDARAEGWARGALTFCLIGLVAMLGLSPAEKLLWATPTMLAFQLLFVLLSASLVRNAVVAVMYWRDRQ